MIHLSSQIKGNWYDRVEMIRDRTSHDLEEWLHFQKEHAKARIDALIKRFEDNGFTSTFKILNPCNLSFK